MTVENQIPYQSFTANGEQASFILGFYVENKENFSVKVNGSLSSSSSYTYNKATNAVVFNTAPSATSLIEVERNTTSERSINYSTSNNTFRPEVLNQDIDRSWLKLQEHDYQIRKKTDNTTKITVGAGLSGGGTLDENITIKVNSTITPKDYGDSFNIPIIHVDQDGIISSITTTNIPVPSSGGTYSVDWTNINNKPTLYTKTEIDDGFLTKIDNLASLSDKQTARNNLSTYSKAEVDTKQATKANLAGGNTFTGTNTFANLTVSGTLSVNLVPLMNTTGTAPLYACRAWAAFNGSSTVVVNASGNIAGIVRVNTGVYTITFTTAMPHANYAVVGSFGGSSNDEGMAVVPYNRTTTSVSFRSKSYGVNPSDFTMISVGVFC